jgi:hypothetical protein
MIFLVIMEGFFKFHIEIETSIYLFLNYYISLRIAYIVYDFTLHNVACFAS